jgi:hypothetical protein
MTEQIARPAITTFTTALAVETMLTRVSLPAEGADAEESEELSEAGAADDASAEGAALDAAGAAEDAAGAAEEDALPCAKAGALVASAMAPKRATIGWIFNLNIVRQFLIGLTGWTPGSSRESVSTPTLVRSRQSHFLTPP